MSNLIGLLGPIGCGKSTVARILERYGYRRISFADALRTEVVDVLTGSMLRAGLNNVPDQIMADLRHPERKQRYRAMIQWWGTEWRRGQDLDYWVNKIRDVLEEKLPIGHHYVIDDVRFPNEAELVHSLGGVLVRVRRPGQDLSAEHYRHESESGGDIPCDHEIANNLEGGLPNLAQMVQALSREIGVKAPRMARVYVSGNMQGYPPGEFAGWSSILREDLQPYGVDCLLPYDRPTDMDGDAIVEHDLYLLHQADAVVAYLRSSSMGTAMEIFFAGHVRKIPVLVVGRDDVIRHPWVKRYARHVIERSDGDWAAVAWATVDMLLQEDHATI